MDSHRRRLQRSTKGLTNEGSAADRKAQRETGAQTAGRQIQAVRAAGMGRKLEGTAGNTDRDGSNTPAKGPRSEDGSSARQNRGETRGKAVRAGDSGGERPSEGRLRGTEHQVETTTEEGNPTPDEDWSAGKSGKAFGNRGESQRGTNAGADSGGERPSEGGRQVPGTQGKPAGEAGAAALNRRIRPRDEGSAGQNRGVKAEGNSAWTRTERTDTALAGEATTQAN